MLSRNSQKSRRKFLAVVGAGMATLAGCSTGDSANGGTPTEDPSPTENPDTAAQGGQTTDSSDQPDDIENDYETRFENDPLTEDYGNWMESKKSMLEIPSWAQDGESKEWSKYDDVPLGYRDFVNVFMNSSADSQGTFVEHFLGVSDEIEDGEYSSEEPYRLVGPWHRIEEVSDQFIGTDDVPVKSSAIERFLQENVHGVIDYGEGTDEELLDYARQ